jgi:hypothetical protein
MTTIENYCKGMVKDGIWMKPDADQETIIALKAQIEVKQHPKSGKTRKDWKLIPPKPGESRKKIVTVNGKRVTYYWCQHHQRWTMHKPQDCCLKTQAQPQPEPKPAATPTTNKQKRDKNQGLALRVMNVFLEDDENDSESIQQDSDEDSQQNQSESE